MPAIRLGTFDYASGAGSAPQQITVPDAIEKLVLRITGLLTVGVAAATLVEDGILNAIRRIVLRKGGDDVVNVGVNERFGAAGKQLQMLQRLWFGELPTLNQPAVGVAANPFDLELVLPLRWSEQLHKNVEPKSALDAGCLRRDGMTTEVLVDWGTDADVATPGGGGTAVVTATAELIAYTRPDLAGAEPGSINRYHRIITESLPVSAAVSAADQQRVNQAQGSSPGFLMLCVDASLRDPDWCNRVRLAINGTDTRLDQSWDAVVAGTRKVAGLQVAVPDGFGWVDFDTGRDFAGYLPLGARSVASAILELNHDVSGGAELRCYLTHVFLP